MSRRKKPPPVCPKHEIALVPANTRYGKRYSCPKHYCTVVCWEGGTSTPADAKTRALRQECHAKFDPLWKTPRGSPFAGGGGRRDLRVAAYAWLSRELGIPKEKTHFGMFDAETCRRALDLINTLLEDQHHAGFRDRSSGRDGRPRGSD